MLRSPREAPGPEAQAQEMTETQLQQVGLSWPLTTRPHITDVLVTILFTQNTMSSHQDSMAKHANCKTPSKGDRAASEAAWRWRWNKPTGDWEPCSLCQGLCGSAGGLQAQRCESQEREIMLRIKTTGRGMKRAFAGHVSKADTAEKRIFAGEALSGQSSKTEKQRSLKKQHKLSQHVGQTQQVWPEPGGNARRMGEREGKKELFPTMPENIQQEMSDSKPLVQKAQRTARTNGKTETSYT